MSAKPSLSLALAIVASLAWWACPPGAGAGVVRPAAAMARPPVVYRPPVDAPITDGFRPPSTPYGPGNRGIDYATRPGTLVRAAAAGTVVFAGPVAGGLHVTIRHDDGIRTSYSFLAAIRMHEGQAVRGGDVVGVAAATLHVGARRGDTYIDPASLWGRPVGPPAVHLVPLDGYQQSRAGGGRRAERQSLLRATSGDLTGLAASTLPGVAAGVAEPVPP